MADLKMTLIDHLEEFRRRMIVSFATILIAAAFCYSYAYRILRILTKPAGKITLVYLSPLEPFMVKFKIAIWAGVFLAMPILIYETLAFVAPALKNKEKKYVYPTIFLLCVLFVSGVVFGYNYIMPVGISWLFSQAGGMLKANLTASMYINFAALFLFAFGISFETPLVILLLVKLGVFTPKSLRENWRIAYMIILVFSAIATPDWSPVTMGIMALPMIILFELSVLLSRII
ncbi:MAG: twin-arginine translocase subunit TatC [Actinobacteria bacterium]|nr:twin-arginine translocase subunit TatC [Actinomycetota bacterium]